MRLRRIQILSPRPAFASERSEDAKSAAPKPVAKAGEIVHEFPKIGLGTPVFVRAAAYPNGQSRDEQISLIKIVANYDSARHFIAMKSWNDDFDEFFLHLHIGIEKDTGSILYRFHRRS